MEIIFMNDLITVPMNPKMTSTLSPLWYQYYSVIKEDAPEILDQYIEETAAKLELTVDYFTAEFL
jgi:hypothetical protein